MLALRVALLLVAVAACGWAAPLQGQGAGEVGAPLNQSSIREEAERRIAELNADTSTGHAERERLVEQYRELIQRLGDDKTFRERAETFRKAIDVAPGETAQLRSELAAIEQGPVQLAPGETLLELQQRVTQLQAGLATHRAQQAELDRRIADERARAAQDLGAEARVALAQIEEELAEAGALSTDPGERERLERALLLARQRARAAEVAQLEQEALSRPARVDLLRARRDLISRRLAVEEAQMTGLESLLNALRQEEAEQAVREAERLRREASDKHALIGELAGEIAEITRETEELLPRIAAVRERGKEVEKQRTQVGQDFEQTSRSLELGVTGALGTVLLELRRSLPSIHSLERAANARSKPVADARLRVFILERDLGDPTSAGAVERLLTEDATAGLSEQAQAALRAELIELMTRKRESLEFLQRALRDYLAAIRDLETNERALIDRTEELAEVLDERLIWIPNAQPLAPSTFGRLGGQLAWLVSPALWVQSYAVLRADFDKQYGSWILATLFVGGLLVARRRMGAPLDDLAARVGKVSKDGMLVTIEALVLQVLRAMPVAAGGVWLGWRLVKAEESTVFSKAVGDGVIAASMVLFALVLLRQFCGPRGVGRVHFRWGERTGQVVRRNLYWFLFIAVPGSFVVVLTQVQPDRLIRHDLGRLTFITLMIAGAVLAYRLLNSSSGVFVGRSAERSSTWLRRSRPYWAPLGMLVPLALAVMAATGYFYAAVQLVYRTNRTVAVILAVLFLHSFLLRWLMVSQRRLALKVALERRAAQAKKSEAGDEEAIAAEGVIDTLDEIDVVEIQGQTQDLLRISLEVVFAVAIWLVWADVLPALGILDDVELWSHEVLIEGQKELRPITLANLGLALLALLVTITAARNMPGFLEIAVLQRMPLEAGARYATRTLVLYAIVGIGIVLAFNAIGVGWSSVQWLLAALTVGLGFGLQEIFANFVSGLIILLERPIRVGDTVTVGEISGVVSRIRMRATTITDWGRRELLVPNKNFITGELINWSLSDPIVRLELTVGIAYGSDTALAHKTLQKILREHPLVLETPEANVFFMGFGDNSLNFEGRVYVTEPTNTGRTRIVHDLHMSIDKACREQGITIAFPQRDLHFKSSEAVLRVAFEGQGDRPPA